jgi:hypothetical protein
MRLTQAKTAARRVIYPTVEEKRASQAPTIYRRAAD